MKVKFSIFILLALVMSLGVTFTASATKEVSKSNTVKHCGAWQNHDPILPDPENPSSFQQQRRLCEEIIVTYHGYYPWGWTTTETILSYEYRWIPVD